MHKHTLSYTRSHRQLSRHVIKLESTRVSRWQRLPLGIEGWSSWSTPWVGDREREEGVEWGGSRANQTSQCDNNFVSTVSKRQTISLGQCKPQYNMYQRADESQSLLSTAKVQMHTSMCLSLRFLWKSGDNSGGKKKKKYYPQDVCISTVGGVLQCSRQSAGWCALFVKHTHTNILHFKCKVKYLIFDVALCLQNIICSLTSMHHHHTLVANNAAQPCDTFHLD